MTRWIAVAGLIFMAGCTTQLKVESVKESESLAVPVPVPDIGQVDQEAMNFDLCGLRLGPLHGSKQECQEWAVTIRQEWTDEGCWRGLDLRHPKKEPAR